MSNIMKIRPAGAELFNSDKWTDTYDEVNCRFSQVCDHASKWWLFCLNIKRLTFQMETKFFLCDVRIKFLKQM